MFCMSHTQSLPLYHTPVLKEQSFVGFKGDFRPRFGFELYLLARICKQTVHDSTCRMRTLVCGGLVVPTSEIVEKTEFQKRRAKCYVQYTYTPIHLCSLAHRIKWQKTMVSMSP